MKILKKMKTMCLFISVGILLFSCGSNNLVPTTKNIQQDANCVSGDCTNGVGKYVFSDGTYEGEWKNGVQQGKGKLVLNEGDTYEGGFQNGSFYGQGDYKSVVQGWHYKGDFKDGDFSGKGFYVCPAGNTYDGNYAQGLRNGYGVFTYKIGSSITKAVAGDKYIGEWKSDDYAGWGILIHKNGSKESGIWENGHKISESKKIEDVINYLNTKHLLTLTTKDI